MREVFNSFFAVPVSLELQLDLSYHAALAICVARRMGSKQRVNIFSHVDALGLSSSYLPRTALSLAL